MVKKDSSTYPYSPMGKQRFLQTHWDINDQVMLTNGKYYTIKGLDIPHNSLLLHSSEYDSDFIADCRIICKKKNKRSVSTQYNKVL